MTFFFSQLEETSKGILLTKVCGLFRAARMHRAPAAFGSVEWTKYFKIGGTVQVQYFSKLIKSKRKYTLLVKYCGDSLHGKPVLAEYNHCGVLYCAGITN